MKHMRIALHSNVVQLYVTLQKRTTSAQMCILRRLWLQAQLVALQNLENASNDGFTSHYSLYNGSLMTNLRT